jgi:adenylate kinase family enzyme
MLPVNVMFIGRSGSGKDTQAELLRKALENRDSAVSILYIYTGAHLRSVMRDTNILTGNLIKENVMDAGNKAPDFLAIWAWAKEFIYRLQEHHNVILSSSPRTVFEAKILDEAFAFYSRSNVCPIYLKVSRDEAFKRLRNRGRFDDTDETINKRLDYFEKWVMSTIEYYRTESKNRLIEIDGNPHDIEKIHHDILRAIGI